ncbi:MAG: hypothetical protein DRH07_07190 [Deltaproteobacteria bacterium]|nr:MAG: hypothetical protein DRH07_07190 [Deltaproteobacteria bacterium]
MMKKLLLADDSITIQKVVGIILSTEEYQLEMTDDGDRAFTKALEDIPDLVIADISMPGKDGFELCRAIKSEPSLSHTSVLLLPGAFDHFDEAKAGEVCADGWLTKPFESQAFLDKISQLLEAAPVKMAGVASAEDEEVPLETPVEVPASVTAATVGEEVLGLDGLDSVDAVAVSSEEVDEDSPDDIWDAVSFAEEDLQEQVEPVPEDSSDAVSFTAEAEDVVAPSVANDVVESVLDEPDFSTVAAEADEVEPAAAEVNNDPVELTASESSEEFQSESFVTGDLGEEEAEKEVELGEQYGSSPEAVSPPAVEEAESVDFSEFSESEDEFQPSISDDTDLPPVSFDDENEEVLELVDELEESPVAAVEEIAVDSEDEDILELASDDLTEENTEEEVAEEEVVPFAFTAAEETIIELQEEENVGDVEPAMMEDETDFSADDEIIDLTDDDIVASAPLEELAVDGVIVGEIETVISSEPDLEPLADDPALVEEEIALAEEEIELAEEEIELAEEDVALAEEEIELAEEETELADEDIELAEEEIEVAESEEEVFYFDEAPEGDNEMPVAAGVASVALATTEEEASSAGQIEQQLAELSEDELKEIVSRVAGPIIEKLAGEMLEKIAWEVVPDLAEAMISEEIRNIKEVV